MKREPKAQYAADHPPSHYVEEKSTGTEWTPKRKELSQQCVSCPFGKGNGAEFQTVLDKLVEVNGAGVADPDMSRFLIKKDLKNLGGDFVCHNTVYDEEMKLKDRSQHRQCPGATAFYRAYRATVKKR